MKLIERGIETALVLIVAVACASPADSEPRSPALGAVDEGDGQRAERYVEVEATGKALRIRNLTDEEIGYAVVEAETATVALFPPCTTPNACPTLAPHGTVVVAYEEIAGYHGGSAEAVVSAWNYVPDPQYGKRAGRMTQTRVRL